MSIVPKARDEMSGDRDGSERRGEESRPGPAERKRKARRRTGYSRNEIPLTTR